MLVGGRVRFFGWHLLPVRVDVTYPSKKLEKHKFGPHTLAKIPIIWRHEAQFLGWRGGKLALADRKLALNESHHRNGHTHVSRDFDCIGGFCSVASI